MDGYVDNGYGAAGYGHLPPVSLAPSTYSRRMNAFNQARALFPYDQPVDVDAVIETARKLDAYFYEA